MGSICDNCKNIISCNNPRKSDPLLLSCQEQKTITNTEFAIVELEKIKAAMHKESYMQPMGNFNDEFDEERRAIDMDDVNYILDKRISELKGEDK